MALPQPAPAGSLRSVGGSLAECNNYVSKERRWKELVVQGEPKSQAGHVIMQRKTVDHAARCEHALDMVLVASAGAESGEG
jgi:hypothetical protein